MNKKAGCEFSSTSQGSNPDGAVEYLPNKSKTLQDYLCAAQLLLNINITHICPETQKAECWIYNKYAESINIRRGTGSTLIASKKRETPTS